MVSPGRRRQGSPAPVSDDCRHALARDTSTVNGGLHHRVTLTPKRCPPCSTYPDGTLPTPTPSPPPTPTPTTTTLPPASVITAVPTPSAEGHGLVADAFKGARPRILRTWASREVSSRRLGRSRPLRRRAAARCEGGPQREHDSGVACVVHAPWRRRAVTTAVQTASGEVRAGLRSGEQVVVPDPAEVTDGMLVGRK